MTNVNGRHHSDELSKSINLHQQIPAYIHNICNDQLLQTPTILRMKYQIANICCYHVMHNSAKHGLAIACRLSICNVGGF